MKASFAPRKSWIPGETALSRKIRQFMLLFYDIHKNRAYIGNKRAAFDLYHTRHMQSKKKQ
jgi:hypothetical protein